MSARDLNPISNLYMDLLFEDDTMTPPPSGTPAPAETPVTEEPADDFSVEVEIDEVPEFLEGCQDLAKTLVDNYTNFFTTGGMDSVDVEGLKKYVAQLFDNGDQEGMLENYGDNSLKYIGNLKTPEYIDHLREIFDFVAEHYKALLR